MANRKMGSIFGGLADRGPGKPGRDGTQMIPDPELRIGENPSLWYQDRAGFGTSVDMTTGGRTAAFGSFAGPEVGENYQEPMGEDRMPVSYVSSNAMKLADSPGSMAASNESGMISSSAPQNYSSASDKTK
jgi:hypothetical protein